DVAEQVACADVVTNVAADLQADFSAGNVIEARAVYVANANVFDRLRFGDHDRVGGTCTGDCDESRSGAEKQALDVHFLTSSQKLKYGSGYFCCRTAFPAPSPLMKKTRSPAPS